MGRRIRAAKEAWRGLRRIGEMHGKQGPTGLDLTAGGWSIIGGTDAIKPEGVFDTLTADQQQKAYCNLDIVFACVREICTTLPEPEISTGYWDADEWHEVETEALELVRHPNKFYSQQKLLYYQCSRLLLTGETFTWKWRHGDTGPVRELWPVPSSWCNVIAGKGSDAIDHFTINQASGATSIPKSVARQNIAYEWLPNPANTIRGCGVMQAISHAYQVEQDRESLIAQMLRNMHVPGLQIYTPEGVNMSVESKRDMRATLYDKVGPGKQGSPLILEGGAKAELLNALADMDMPGLADMDETRICAGFGVHPILIGARVGLENSPWSKYSEARKSFYQETMIPLWTSFEQFWTQTLLRDEGEHRLQFYFDYSNVAALQEDRKQQAEIGGLAIGKGAITRNEYRGMLGLEAVADGDVYLLPINIIEQPQRAAVEEPERDAA